MNATLLRALLALTLLGATTGFAQEKEDDDLVEKVVVRNRLFNVEKRLEIGANVGFSMLSRLTDHYNLNASVAYNFADTLAAELRIGYAIAQNTGLANDVASKTSTSTKATDLADLWQMNFNTVVGLRWQPVYGKISVLAELPVHFQFYLWAGGGLGTFHRESVVLCKAGTNCFTEDKVGPLVSLALGMRFFLTQRHSVKLEMRDYSYLDSYLTNIDRTKISTANPTGGGTPSPSATITNLVQIDVGYAFTF